MTDPVAVALISRPNGRNIIQHFTDDPHQLATTLEEAQHEGATLKDRDRFYDGCVDLIFAFWAAKTDHPTSRLDPKRRRSILNRLLESGGDVDEGLFVVNGLLKDRRLMGDNDRSTRYDGIETIFRDRAMVERLSVLGGYREGRRHPMAAKYIDGGVQ